MNIKEQKEYIFNWLSEICGERDIIRLKDGKKAEYFKFNFPLKSGDKPKKIKKPSLKKDVFFEIIFSPNLNKINKVVNDSWNIIFLSPCVCILENKRRTDCSCFKGEKITKEEKHLCLRIVRMVLEEFFISKKIPNINKFNIDLSKNFFLFNSNFDLSVYFWVDGVLRRSIIKENKILFDGLAEAAIEAARSMQFKPLNSDDLLNTRIEVALFSRLRIPLNEDEIKKDEIYFGKGYLIENRSKREFILPEFFVEEKIYSLNEFLNKFSTKKFVITKKEIKNKKTKIFVFEIVDFIESKNRDNVLNVEGSIAMNQDDSRMGIESCFSLAAEWLVANQEKNGNFPPISNPLNANEGKNKIDWPRSALNGWSLIEFGKTVNNDKYIQAGKKNCSYLERYLLDENILSKSDFPHIILTIAYLGQSALSLGEYAKAHKCGKIIFEKIRDLRFESILFQQIGSFFVELSKIDKIFWIPGIEIANIAGDFFERNKNQMNLAFTAELINLYLKIFQISDDKEYLLKAKKITDWLLNYQLISGEFKSSANCNFPVTRGTGKIIEVLSTIVTMGNNREIKEIFDVEAIEKCIEKSLDWIKKMQYDNENTYFIPKTDLKYSLGGIRHDYFNIEMWGDSVGHLLLAGSRFLTKKG